MHGLPVLEQELSAVTDLDAGSVSEESAQAVGQAGWGLGGTGPVLKTQTIVSFVSVGYRPTAGVEKKGQKTIRVLVHTAVVDDVCWQSLGASL